MEADFRTILISDNDLTAIVPPERISYAESPQGAANPRIVYRVKATNVLEELDGETGWATSRIRIEIWADDDATATQIAQLLALRLSGFAGVIGSTRFFDAMRFGRSDETPRPVHGNARGDRLLTLDFTVNYWSV